MDSTRWLLTKEAANYLGMHPDTLREKYRSGEIHAEKREGTKPWRTKKEWLDAYLMGGHAA